VKTISAALKTHFGLDCTTLSVLWKAKRNDGVIFGFTNHDEDITYDDGLGDGPVTYKAATGFTYSATETKDDMSPDNLEVTGFLDSSAITVNDIRAGLWNDATIQTYVVNWADLTMGDLKLRQGTTGQVKMVNGVFTVEVRGLTQKLSTVIGAQYGPLCRAEFGSGLNGIDMDSHYLCNVDVTLYRVTGSVVSSPDARTLVPSALTAPSPTNTNKLRPATLLNGWGSNGHVGDYEHGVAQGHSSPLQTDSGTTQGYTNPGNAFDADATTFAQTNMLHTHSYAGCVWAGGSWSGTAANGGVLSIVSEVPAGYALRDAGIWYSLNGGTTWTLLYQSTNRSKRQDDIVIPNGQNLANVQIMAFTDAHDDMGHKIYDIYLITNNAPGTTVAAPAGWFNDGLLKFTSGVMNNFYVEIKNWDGVTLTTFLPMPFQPGPGDTFQIEPGCDKTSATCFSKYNNIVNFRGEPFIPGNDLILLYPNQK
jgi:uncharacterized phage protein (TIGR02218 family)